MLEYFLNTISSLPPHWMFAAVIFILLICGLGAPFPEEIPLFITGYLVYKETISLQWGISLTLLAVLLGDSLLFWIGYHLGNRIFETPIFRKLMTPQRVEKVNHYFHRYGNRVIFLARFMAGVRGPVFLTAGILRMPFIRFIFFDGIAAMLSVPTIVWVTYHFCKRFEGEIAQATKMVKKTERFIVILALLLVTALSILIYRIQKNRKKGALAKVEGKPLDV